MAFWLSTPHAYHPFIPSTPLLPYDTLAATYDYCHAINALGLSPTLCLPPIHFTSLCSYKTPSPPFILQLLKRTRQ